MSKVALADELAEWDSILGGLSNIEELDKPDLQELAAKLTAMSRAVRDLSAEQEALEARRRSITQQLRITRRLGRTSRSGSRRPSRVRWDTATSF